MRLQCDRMRLHRFVFRASTPCRICIFSWMRVLYQDTVARAISDDLTLSDHSTGTFVFPIASFPQRRLRWALLSVVGSIVCVSGAWPMRSARNSMEEPAATVCKTDGSFCEVSKDIQPGLRNASENPAR